MNRAWHEQHRMPKSATLDERISWHRMHQEHCACRPVPEKAARLMTTRAGLENARRRRRTSQSRVDR